MIVGRVSISEDGESAYAEIYPSTSAEVIRGIHVRLAEQGFELMDPDECPAESSTDGLGVRMWAAKMGERLAG